jgi:hypothetical protein
MSGRTEELRNRDASITKTPTIATDDGDYGGSSDGNDTGDSALSSLPVPSLTKRQLLILAAICVVVTLIAIQRRDDGGSETASEEDIEELPDIDDQNGGEIEVPETDDPLAGDEIITQEFRERGYLNSEE